MTDLIIEALKEAGVEEYRIADTKTCSAEAFFVKKRLDLKRAKDVRNITVTVFNVFEADGRKMKGSANVFAFPGMTVEELTAKFRSAYAAAALVKNPYYELCEPEKGSEIKDLPELGEAVGIMADALFLADSDGEAFINSAEFFAESSEHRVISSSGTDVSFNTFNIRGEFVAQCREPRDVETYMDFAYDTLDTEAINSLAKETIETTKARAKAATAPKAGNYRVIISGRYVADIFDYYIRRSDCAYIYARYSDYKIGDRLQGEVKGDSLDITLKARNPYSFEGIRMHDLKLVEGGELKAIHGGERFAAYLDVKPTGDYNSFEVGAGSISVDDMKKEPYLNIVNFSDFQMDAMNGSFGGEIRLAFLFDGEKTIPVTGGSVNANILELQDNIRLSKEIRKTLKYTGPEAICFEKAAVAGE